MYGTGVRQCQLSSLGCCLNGTGAVAAGKSGTELAGTAAAETRKAGTETAGYTLDGDGVTRRQYEWWSDPSICGIGSDGGDGDLLER